MRTPGCFFATTPHPSVPHSVFCVFDLLNGQQSWAVLLAGGDGTRLRNLTRRIAGDCRPKQFCSLFGGKSLLAQTRDRVNSLFPPERTMFVLARDHEQFYRDQLFGVHESGLVVQPKNRGTGVAIAVSLLRIVERHPEALVAFFPCDHYYADDEAFTRMICWAMHAVRQYPERIVVVGAEADYPETEYGWIEAGAALGDGPVFRVRRFWEKPSLLKARSLWRRGCLWNTFVTIGRAGALLDLLRSQVPDLLPRLSGKDLDPVYQAIEPMDFSRDVLTPMADRLLVVRDAASGWADLGNPERVVETLMKNRIEPAWLCEGTKVEWA